MISKSIKKRDDLLRSIVNSGYELKAQQACGCYLIKKEKEIIANLGVTGNIIEIKFR